MITKRRVIDTIDMAMEGYRHRAAYAFNRLKKPELSPAQLKWLARRCASDIKDIDGLWHALRKYLISDETVNTQTLQDLLRSIREAEYSESN